MSSRNSKQLDLEGEYNPSDSEDEYSEEEKRLLDKARQRHGDDTESEEEVYGFSASESDKDAMAASDIEGQEGSEDDLPDSRAWGQKKKAFYSTDFVDEDFGGFGKDEEAATLEEKEARILQNKLAMNLEDDDFALEFFTSKKADNLKENEKEILIKSDLSQMSKREKLQLLEKESPEFSGLVEDFKNKISLANTTLLPVIKLFKEGTLPQCPALHFIKTQYELILNYCTNISFYILLKTKRINIHNHPVIKRLFQYRQMLKQLEPIFEKDVKPQIIQILEAKKQNQIIEITSDGSKKRKSNVKQRAVKKLKLLDNINGEKHTEDIVDEGSDDENVASETDDEIDDTQIEIDKDLIVQSEESVDGTEKRAITYQMAKNKGLTPHRKKEQRNPRVKHRNKYRKAQIRRKGAVREVKHELNRYAGEMSGIKSNVKKSIKIR